MSKKSDANAVTIARKDFVEWLDVCEPALAASSLLPILGYYWFRDDKVMAYNDVIAIEAPLKLGFTGATPGHMLLKLIKAATGKDVKLTIGDTEVKARCGIADFKFPKLLENAFIFDMPKIEGKGFAAGAFVSAIEHCLRSVSSDTAHPERTGVTCIFDDKGGTSLYSTDDNTISHVRIEGDTPDKLERVVLPAMFCREFVKLAKGGRASLHFGKDYVQAVINDNVRLFGRLILLGDAKPMSYRQILDHNMPKGVVPIKPKRFADAVERACIVADSNLEQRHTEITVTDDGYIDIVTISPMAEARDELEAAKDQAPVTIKVEPKYLKDTDDFERVVIQANSIVFVNEAATRVYMVAAMSQKGR